MHDKYSGFLVSMETDLTEKDTEAVINALRMISGVIEVEPVKTNKIIASIVEHRMRGELFDVVQTALYPQKGD
jgi:hypothetical protein